MFYKAIAPILFVANLMVVFLIWTNESAAGLVSNNLGNVFIALGNLAGLLAFYLALWQLLLIGRVSWIEKAFGHDKLSRLHHWSGILVAIIILFHPSLITWGYSYNLKVAFTNQFLVFLFQYENIIFAFLAYLIILGVVLISLWIVRQRLRYEYWHFIHLSMYLAIILAFSHQLNFGRDLAHGWAATYWIFLTYAVFSVAIFYRFFLPVWHFWQYRFQVTKIEMETHDVRSIYISGKSLNRLKVEPGQFIIVRFLTKGFWWEAHPFTVSNVFDGKNLRITVKESGDFTSKLAKLPLGALVLIEGPLGRFTAEKAQQGKILMIAGGIGITPLRALFEKFANQRKQVSLIYSAKTEADFALKNELDKLQTAQAKVYYLPNDQAGRITAEYISAKVPDVAKREVYLCGPAAMMKQMKIYLRHLGVSKKTIFFEKFKLG